MTSAEDGISNAILGLVSVKEAVVHGIDEELTGSGIGIGSARHGYGVALVAQSVAGLILDGGVPGFLLHILGESAALDQ